MKTIHTRDFNNQGNKISCTIDVKDGTDVITSEVIEFRSVEEMNSRLTNIKNNANHIAEIFPTLMAGEWTEPVVDVVENKYESAKMTLESMKREVELGLKTEAEYDLEVVKVKALNNVGVKK